MDWYRLAWIGNGLLEICVVACWLTLVVQTFIRGETGMGLVCLLLFCCCGAGIIVGLGYGWAKANEWNNVTLMLAYTASCGMLALSFLATYALALLEMKG
ncbi:MAG TPA: hypothetical protein VJ783_22160 [Pirellulales bacterium]|nr:hypothetical protein [Pirellulales bacterium]